MSFKEKLKLSDNDLKNVNGGMQDINGTFSLNTGDCFSYRDIRGVDVVRLIVLDTYIDVPAYTIINVKRIYMNEDGTTASEDIIEFPICHDFLDKSIYFRGNGIWQ